MYKRIAGAEDQATLADVRAELQDRYGTLPETVLNLLAAGELRLRCEQIGISQIDRKRTQIELPNPNGNKKAPLKSFVEMLHIKFAAVNADPSHFADKSNKTVDPGMLMKLVSRNSKRGAQFSPNGTLRWPLPSAKAEDVLAETRALLDALDTRHP
jgi:transcription-repair coupling factor (superfamily II helicase)